MGELEELARVLDALGHVVRLRIVRELARGGEMYLSEIAGRVGVSRALAKIHLRKLERAGLVRSRLVLDEERGRALRYYRLMPFRVEVSPERLLEVRENG